jgi:hypothetical protein
VNLNVVTTGLVPLVIGSIETFVHSVVLNGIPDSLAGGTATLTLQDPAGNQTILAASIVGSVAQATWTVTAPVGNWTRAWTWTDANGVHQVSRPIPFSVVTSP